MQGCHQVAADDVNTQHPIQGLDLPHPLHLQPAHSPPPFRYPPQPYASPSQSEDFKSAASLAAGGVACGNLPHFLASLLSLIFPLPHPFNPSSASPSQVEKAITASLASDSEDIKSAASLAAGGVACGNLPHYLPSLLSLIGGAQGDPKRQYLLLQALGEVIATISAVGQSRMDLSEGARGWKCEHVCGGCGMGIG